MIGIEARNTETQVVGNIILEPGLNGITNATNVIGNQIYQGLAASFVSAILVIIPFAFFNIIEAGL